MEDFIKEIYQEADIIEQLKEFSFLINSYRPRDGRSIYNKCAEKLEGTLERLATSDLSTARQIQDIAIKIKDSYNDPCLAKGIINGKLIPLLYSYMTAYTGIKVTEGKYTIASSDTGYLTIRDNEQGIYLHETHDPMWEAYETVRTILNPQAEEFLIFGSGLGYTAYQVWHQSEGFSNIYLYEDDPVILDYAYKYGVLSLIPEKNLSIIHNINKIELATEFIHNLIEMNIGEGFIFSHWKKSLYKDLCSNEIDRIVINHELFLEMNNRTLTNLYKNRQLQQVLFKDIAVNYKYKEWLVISAGPSFDESIDFIKSSIGIRGLIAVNTVLRRLIKEGIKPDIIVAADQYSQMIDHIKGIEYYTKDIPLIADWFLNWKYAELYQGPISFVRTNSNPKLTKEILPNEPLWDINGTVACLAIEAAVKLGAGRIYLVGQDLAYPSGQKYAKGMPHAEVSNVKGDMQVLSVDGSMVNTCEAFDWFRKAIEYQIAKYNDVKFINMSKHGAYISGAISNPD